YAESRAEVKENARKMLDETVQETVGGDAGVIQRIEHGPPAEVLVAASGSAQLLVLGTRGHGAFAGMLLGSVSQHCVAHSKCPFVVVPNPEGRSKGKAKKK
ncbi:MAG: universal stress protein, partial [Micrococcaceae bacterium]|nr:universal stress protein [Micrococcaceae bacterium]